VEDFFEVEESKSKEAALDLSEYKKKQANDMGSRLSNRI
jgi:hypothetical protein